MAVVPRPTPPKSSQVELELNWNWKWNWKWNYNWYGIPTLPRLLTTKRDSDRFLNRLLQSILVQFIFPPSCQSFTRPAYISDISCRDMGQPEIPRKFSYYMRCARPSTYRLLPTYVLYSSRRLNPRLMGDRSNPGCDSTPLWVLHSTYPFPSSPSSLGIAYLAI